MLPFHRIIAKTFVFRAIASCDGAAFAADAVTVVFRDESFVVTDPAVGAIVRVTSVHSPLSRISRQFQLD